MIQYREEENFIVRTNDDGSESWIPKDEANSDYQRYLNPEAEQSTPIVIDEAKTKYGCYTATRTV
jgi:hypothetical protein